MSKKNSSVLTNSSSYQEDKYFSKVYSHFKTHIKDIKAQKFLIAVSGGPDSLALTALAKEYSREFKKKFFFATVNHNIRKQSANEAKTLKKLLNNYKLNLHILNNKKKITKNIQANARKIRYNLLKSFCSKKKIRLIITAHHREDQIETFLIRLSRGSGVQGLSSMSQSVKLDKNLYLFRPLLDCKKDDLIKISKNIFKKYIQDPSNNNKKYLRTNMRILTKKMNANGISNDQILNSIKNLSLSRDTINIYLDNAYKKNVVKRNKIHLIKLNQFKKESDEIKVKILGLIFKKVSGLYYPPRGKKLNFVVEKMVKEGVKKLTLAGCLIKNSGTSLIIEKEPKN